MSDYEQGHDDVDAALQSSSESSDELDGPDFDEPDVEVLKEVPDDFPECVLGRQVYHRYDDGWYPARVLRQITCSSSRARNGKFALKFADSVNEIDHTLDPDDYGPARHWVLTKA